MTGDASAEATLLLTPDGVLDADACRSALTGGDPAGTAVLLVAFASMPDATVRQWDARAGALPARLGVVSVGEGTRTAARATTDGGIAGNDRVRVEAVGEARDLTGIGIAVDELLPFLAGGDRLVACVDSLTPLLGATDERQAFRFVHVLTRRLKAAGADVHAHLDPAAHDDRTVATFRSLFDDARRAE